MSNTAAFKVKNDLEVGGSSLTTNLDLAAIAETKAVTAVDVFVYDTSKDSDGGAWRKRTQHTSWYNETLNTSTRGSRREFPAVAVIVLTAQNLTIYDGDDPSLPMWMVFDDDYADMVPQNANQKAISALNGIICNVATQFAQVNFISDNGLRLASNTSGYYQGNISERNDAKGYDTSISARIVNSNVNDVAMTVLPNAPIDPATGLPVPTIAVATLGGVSVITDSGAVHDSASALTMGQLFFDDTGGLFYSRSVTDGVLWYSTRADYEAGDGFGDEIARTTFGTNNFDILTYSQSNANSAWLSDSFAFGGDIASLLGLMLHQPNYTDQSKGMSALLTSTYNTGWMNGDIKGAFLSDTDDTDLVGSGELVTNGTFDTDVSGWTSGSSGILTRTTTDFPDGALQIENGTAAEGFAFEAVSGLTVGKTYILSLETGASGTSGTRIRAGAGSSSGLSDYVNVDAVAQGSFVQYSFVATSTNLAITLYCRVAIAGRTTIIDNVSVKLADADRSVNNNGLIVNGTVTRSPVATGADLVAYSGFSASNYLEQPYNSDLDFGTGDFCVMGWVKTAGSFGDILDRGDGTTSNNLRVKLTTGNVPRLSVASTTITGSIDVGTDTWRFLTYVRSGGVGYIYVDTALDVSGAMAGTVGTGVPTVVGNRYDQTAAHNGSLALWRISATAPTAEQIKKIYEDEKVLFQENAQATLYGSSDAVTALAHDPVTDLLHVGTSAGRSVFQGLRRVDNTTTAVGTAISASNSLVVEE